MRLTCSRRRSYILVFVLSAAVMSLMFLIYAHVRLVSSRPNTISLVALTELHDTTLKPKLTSPRIEIKHYDVLLNSYMRSGSTLTGMILGWRNDAFYLYEPMQKIALWTYWHGRYNICSTDAFGCGLSGVPVDKVMQMLNNLYDCKFNDEFAFNLELTAERGGPKWKEVTTCLKKKIKPEVCLRQYNLTQRCKSATHRVSKVLRLTTDLLGDLLREKENLKVIHLVRDPRAIINSRSKAAWYSVHTPKKLIESAKSLCNKMLYDFRQGQKLLALYPDRFRFIYYEDFIENPLDKIEILYKYLGMDLNETKYPQLNTLPVISGSIQKTELVQITAFRWRLSLDWNLVKEMQPSCEEVYRELGYTSFTDLKDYRNMSKSSVRIPKKYLIS